MTAITVSNLASTNVDAGTGVFDVLLRSVKAHLDQQFTAGRIKGPEYATVYLGQLDMAMQTALSFLLQQQKVDLEAQLLTQQILLAEQALVKGAAEIAQVEAQTAMINQQKANLIAEELNIPKQGLLIEAQKAQVTQQTTNLVSEGLGIVAKTALTTQQAVNAVTEELVLVAQKCRLQAEFDLTQAQVLKSAQELELLTQKTSTEKAQITSLGVDADSVVGRQKALYLAQSDGFKRDAEQKAAKLLVDTWSVRRTTDEGTVADATNMLNDATVGRAVDKLLAGVGA